MYGLIKRFLPKGTDLDNISDETAQKLKIGLIAA